MVSVQLVVMIPLSTFPTFNCQPRCDVTYQGQITVEHKSVLTLDCVPKVLFLTSVVTLVSGLSSFDFENE